MAIDSLICDKEGVPFLIQRLEYYRSDMSFEAVFFNGKSKRFFEEHVGNCMGLMDMQPTKMQALQVQNFIEKLAIDNWKKWFPYICAVA